MATNNDNVQLNAGCSIQLDVFDLNQHGQGVAKYHGLIVFIDGALPDERVQARIITVKKKYATAVIEEILVRSGNRIEPVCPLAERCGGCAVQHLDYPAQLEWKQGHIAGLLDRAKPTGWKSEKMLPILGMDNPYYYRGKVQIPIAGDTNNILAGFYERKSHQVVDGDICYIQHPLADLVRAEIRQYIKEYKISIYNERNHTGSIRHIVVRIGYYTGQLMVIIVSKDSSLPYLDRLVERIRAQVESYNSQPLAAAECDSKATAPHLKYELKSFWLNINDKRSNIVMDGELKLLYGQEYVRESISGVDYRISPRAFFQINPRQTVQLYSRVLKAARLQGSETVLDLYCGTGSISLLLAQAAEKVIGVEIVAEAIDDARINAKQNGIRNVSFVSAAAERWLPDYAASGKSADVAVIDPPRKGCDDRLIEALCAADIPVLVYVSCNPATMVRDLVKLGSVYAIDHVQPVDMFPHSDSVECITRLERFNQLVVEKTTKK